MDEVEEQGFDNTILSLLHDRGSEGVSLHELSQLDAFSGDQLSTLRYVMLLLECGKPLGIDNPENIWAFFNLSDQTKVFLANRPDELKETENLVHAQIDGLRTLLDGVDMAKSNLRETCR